MATNIMRSVIFVVLALCWVVPVSAQLDFRMQNAENRLSAIDSRLSRLERQVSSASTAGVAVFLFGAFCALWAQNTGRNAWLWFFLGLFFSVITVFVLLAKNSNDIDRRTREGGRRPFNLQDFRRQ